MRLSGGSLCHRVLRITTCNTWLSQLDSAGHSHRSTFPWLLSLENLWGLCLLPFLSLGTSHMYRQGLLRWQVAVASCLASQFPLFYRKLSSLEYLDLSSNNLSRVPAGLPRSLVLLHLEKNVIQSVDADVLTPIRSLEYLLLHSNQLQAKGIHPLAFQGLKKLHTVHLYNNALERVPSGLPRRVRTLMILHNQITGIGREDFATTYFLEELNLSYNRITSPQMHRDAFRKLRLLRSLDLSGNRLQTLPPGLPKNVHVLKVKRNELAALARGALAGMAQLRELYLTANRLRSRALGPRAWVDLAGLQVLQDWAMRGGVGLRGGG